MNKKEEQEAKRMELNTLVVNNRIDDAKKKWFEMMRELEGDEINQIYGLNHDMLPLHCMCTGIFSDHLREFLIEFPNCNINQCHQMPMPILYSMYLQNELQIFLELLASDNIANLECKCMHIKNGGGISLREYVQFEYAMIAGTFNITVLQSREDEDRARTLLLSYAKDPYEGRAQVRKTIGYYSTKPGNVKGSAIVMCCVLLIENGIYNLVI